MNRRTLFLFVLGLPLLGASHAPSSAETLNYFVREYNKYIAKLGEGLVDVKQWEKVEKAWRKIK